MIGARRPRAHTESGFGLLLVVVVLAIIGAMSFGAFAIARREFRTAIDLGYAAQAFEAAESGLAAAASAAGAVGPMLPLSPQAGPVDAAGQDRFTTSIVRLNESLWLLTSLGEYLDGTGGVLARRSLGLVGKLVADSTSERFEPLESWGWGEMF